MPQPVIADYKEFRLLVEVQGPFVSTSVLRETFPQGFPKESTLSDDLRRIRIAYETWTAAPAFDLAAHQAWLRFVLTDVLEFDDAVLTTGQAIPQSLRVHLPASRADITPDLLIITQPEEDLLGDITAPAKPLIPVFFHPRAQKIEKPLPPEFGARLTPIDRAVAFLRSSSFPIALLTNGEQWTVVHAPADGVTSTAAFYAEMWLEESVTFRAFRALTGVRRWLQAEATSTLPKLLERSALNQGAVTKQLGRQVLQAVELLILAIDRADQDKSRGLLANVSEATLYEAAISVMMRLVFLFFAEERELLPASDLLYAGAYAVSTIREQLQADADRFGPEVLERRHDAWSRLLATFRAVHAGLEHDRLTLPAYGGQLFDPDRFCFLEGRPEGTSWRDTPSAPLPVDNRTVLYALEALQILWERGSEPRQLTFRELDVPDIGHVYESLLDHTAKRASVVTLGLVGREGDEAEVEIAQLEHWHNIGTDRLLSELKDLTGKTLISLTNLLAAQVDSRTRERLRTACGGDPRLLDRLLPFANILRDDSWGHPIIILPGSVFVTEGVDRRATGTHYTPTSLTEPIVRYTLEPLVYDGPSENKSPEQWQLKPASELLELKVCDMACGSGAFLVAAGRYLSARLEEAWGNLGAFAAGAPRRSPEGFESTGSPDEDLIPLEPEARQVYSLRVIAQRCLYGVDKNHLAVEMAKLSLWLLTLAKGKPFTFLDHAIKCGDSLIGVNRRQLEAFDLDDTRSPVFGFGPTIDYLRNTRETLAIVRAETVTDVERQARLLMDAERKTEALRWIADALIGMTFMDIDEGERMPIGAELGLALQHSDFKSVRDLSERYPSATRPFHWDLEFPEVFDGRSGFDAFLGNPPFMGGLKLETAFGTSWRAYVVEYLAKGVRGVRGTADICVYFILRACQLIKDHGCVGFLATNTVSEGDSRVVGLDQLTDRGIEIFRAVKSCTWPGTANLEVSQLFLRNGLWTGPVFLDNRLVERITPHLTPQGKVVGRPLPLLSNAGIAFQGSIVLGKGLILDFEEGIRMRKNPRNADVVLRYMNGDDLNSRFDQSSGRWVINFLDWPLTRATSPSGYEGPVAADYPDCLKIVEERAKPERMAYDPINAWNKKVFTYWWHFGQYRWALHEAMKGKEQVLVSCRHTKYVTHSLVPAGPVFDVALNVIVISDGPLLSILESNIYEAWVRLYGSSLETRLRYTLKDCFETFPFPQRKTIDNELARQGRLFHSARRSIMTDRHEGLTDVYNRFHNSQEKSADIVELRRRQMNIDKAVIAAYGLTEELDHGFHETKQGVRFTISPQACGRVLDILLALNHQQHLAELQRIETLPKRKLTRTRRASTGASLFE